MFYIKILQSINYLSITGCTFESHSLMFIIAIKYCCGKLCDHYLEHTNHSIFCLNFLFNKFIRVK